VPVIATAQQLSSGLCRLYGVEPGRLKLSGVLEASRGAVGITGLSASKTSHFVDDSRPLLDDDVYIDLKSTPKKTKRNGRIEALRPKSETAPPSAAASDSADNRETPEPTAEPQEPVVPSAAASVEPQDSPQIQEVKPVEPVEPAPHTPPVIEQLEPDFVAAINVLGLSLTIIQSKSEAVSMVNTRLKDFTFTLHLLDNNNALIVWNGVSHEIPLANIDAHNKVPPQFKTLLKKISQCPSE